MYNFWKNIVSSIKFILDYSLTGIRILLYQPLAMVLIPGTYFKKILENRLLTFFVIKFEQEEKSKLEDFLYITKTLKIRAIFDTPEIWNIWGLDEDLKSIWSDYEEEEDFIYGN